MTTKLPFALIFAALLTSCSHKPAQVGPAALLGTATRAHPRAHQITSGARLTIFMKLRSRSSRATGPNTRVPIGSF